MSRLRIPRLASHARLRRRTASTSLSLETASRARLRRDLHGPPPPRRRLRISRPRPSPSSPQTLAAVASDTNEIDLGFASDDRGGNMTTDLHPEANMPCCEVCDGNNMATASLTEAIKPCCRIPPGPPAPVNWRAPGCWEMICSLLTNINDHFEVYEWYDGVGLDVDLPTLGELMDHPFDPFNNVIHGFSFLIVGYAGAKEVLEDTHIIDGKAISIKSIVFVGGLSTTVTDVEFVNFFSKFGKIVVTEIVLHPITKQQQNIGFVVFESEQDAKDLVKKKEINFLGSKVMLKAAEIHIKRIPQSYEGPAYEGFFSFSEHAGYNTQNLTGYNTRYGRSFDPSQRALGSFVGGFGSYQASGSFGGDIGPSYCAPGSFGERNICGFS